MGKEANRLRFLVMKELAVPLILGCEFLNEHVRSILPKDQKIELLSGETIPLYTQTMRRHPTRVYMAQGVTLSLYRETNILVRTENNGTCLIQNGNRTNSSNTLPYALAAGISNILQHQHFVLRVGNYGSIPIHLQNHRVMGLATAVHDDIF
jgi:hypothetical protein